MAVGGSVYLLGLWLRSVLESFKMAVGGSVYLLGLWSRSVLEGQVLIPWRRCCLAPTVRYIWACGISRASLRKHF
eukprot:4389843-Pyramimonas_sp.AAC.2